MGIDILRDVKCGSGRICECIVSSGECSSGAVVNVRSISRFCECDLL